MTDEAQVRERVRAFIYEKFPLARKQGLKDQDALLESGLLDSMGVLDLVGFIEGNFGIQVIDEELVPENFGTVEQLARFVLTKSDAKSALEKH